MEFADITPRLPTAPRAATSDILEEMGLRRSRAGTSLPEAWKTTISGSEAQRFLVDRPGTSVLVGSGWGIPYPASRLDRLSLTSGTKAASVRTRVCPQFG